MDAITAPDLTEADVQSESLPTEISTTIEDLLHDLGARSRDAIVGRSWNTEERFEARQRQLNALSREAIYMIQVGIALGGNSVRLNYNQLGLHPDVVSALSKARATTPTIPIFQELRKLGNKLSGDRKRLQERHLLYGDPWWFYPESKFPEVAGAIDALFETYEQYRQAVTDDETYRKGFQHYLETVGRILAKADIPPDKLDSTLKSYASRFPTQDQLRDSFRLKILGPFRVPSLTEQAVDNAQLREAIAQEAEASVKHQEAIAKEQLNARMLAEIQTTLSTSIDNCRTEIQGLIGDSLNRATSIADGNVSNQMKQGIRRNLDRLQNLVVFDRSLAELVDATHALADEAVEGTKHSFSTQMAGVESLLEKEFAVKTATTGHRALARRMLD